MAEAFLYCWTDNKSNMLYIGAHKGSPNDGYVCSSKLMLEQYNIRSKDFSRQIIAEGTAKDIFNLENIILRKLNVAESNEFYNKHNGFGGLLSEDVKKKIGKKSKLLWEDNEYREKMSSIRKEIWANKSPEFMKNFSEKMSLLNKGKKKSESTREKLRGKRPHVNQSGSNNNNAKLIETPYGIFGRLKEASVNLNMTYRTVYYNLNSNKIGWRYM